MPPQTTNYRELHDIVYVKSGAWHTLDVDDPVEYPILLKSEVEVLDGTMLVRMVECPSVVKVNEELVLVRLLSDTVNIASSCSVELPVNRASVVKVTDAIDAKTFEMAVLASQIQVQDSLSGPVTTEIHCPSVIEIQDALVLSYGPTAHPGGWEKKEPEASDWTKQ